MLKKSVFAAGRGKVWPVRYEVTLSVENLTAGVPADPNVIEAWIGRSVRNDEEYKQQLIARNMQELGFTVDEAVEDLASLKGLSAFKREKGRPYVEGRQVKAALKEAASSSAQVGAADSPISFAVRNTKGEGKKALIPFIAEHIMVPDIRIFPEFELEEPGTELPVRDSLVHTWRGDSFKKEEYIPECALSFTVLANYEFGENWWETIWLTGEQLGVGASRSQGHGRYAVTRWDRVK